MKTTTALILALLVAGCATGFDRGALRERLEDEKLEVTDDAIQKALVRRPQLRFPIKVAVHLAAETFDRGRRGAESMPAYNWRWDVEDRKVIETWTEVLRKNGVVADMFVMSDMISTGNDLKSIRLAAAKHGADAVLLVRGVVQVDRYVNPLCVLNVLIFPGWLVSASHRDACLLLKGAMWDVGNEFLYLSVDAEGEGSMQAPTFKISDADAIQPAKAQALASFGRELVRRMTNLKPRR